MNYIDKNIKNIEENKYIIKYCSDNRIIAKRYELV